MSYSIALHNGTSQVLSALLLLALGAWASARVYKFTRPGPAILLAVLVLSTVLSAALLLWGRRDGPCGTVWGIPLIVEREQTACTDVVDSTGVSIPFAAVDCLVALGLAHVIVLSVLQLRRTVGQR